MTDARSLRPMLFAALLLAGLSACARPTPYQPATASDTGRGYDDQRIEENRFQVSFAGNSLTPPETVERYLLYRAAEVTVAAGYDWFRIVERDRVLSAMPETGRSRVGRRPYRHRYPYHPGPRVRFGFGFGYPGFYYGAPVVVHAPQRVRAFAEILAYRGEKPAGEPDAYDAHDILARLGPSILRPEP